MEIVHDVLPVSSLAGKLVLSLETGNKLGELRDLFIDPINGLVLGITIGDGETATGLPYEAIYSFGHDAIMAISESALKPLEECSFGSSPRAANLVGTQVITVGGNVIGHVRNVFVTLQRPPIVVYSVGESLLDRLLGREWYILASDGHALSDDAARLVVPEFTAANTGKSIEELLNPAFSVRSYDQDAPHDTGEDDTHVIPHRDYSETISGTDDDTVVRLRPDLAA